VSKQYKNYQEVPNKYKFDLEFLLEGKTKEERLKELLNFLDQQIKEKDSKYESKESYLKSLKLNDKITIKANKLFNYISNNISVNVVDDKMNSFYEKVQYDFYLKEQELGPEEPRFFKNSSKIEK
jgi:oligoendopeptidase F